MTSSAANLIANEQQQFRMKRLQLYNWGTFSDLHDVPIAARGFLVVGPSGAGKSTLLDAFTALLVPPKWINFNAASQDVGSDDRDLVSYVRGAWAEQKDDDSNEIVLRYLRKGTTWSGLSLSFSNEAGETTVLIKLLWIRGSSTKPTDVQRYYLIANRAFDLREFEDFGRTNFDIRKLKQSFPDFFGRSDFGPYGERFRRLLGIDSEMALRLLHKTQSAKSLGDLNTFLRDFMLDKPKTFDAAERLVSEFVELNAAHQAVVTAREQVQTLVPARLEHERLQILVAKNDGLSDVRKNINAYRELRRQSLLEKYISSLTTESNGLESDVLSKQQVHSSHCQTLNDLRTQHLKAGGGRIQHWHTEKTLMEGQRSQRTQKRQQIVTACSALDWNVPTSPQMFAELCTVAREEVEQSQHLNRELQGRRDQLVARKQVIEERFVKTTREVEALRRQSSNIPAEMLDLRRSIADALELSDSALPFVGELLEVRLEDSRWQGALERVLHNFALSILVDESHFTELSNYVNANHLGNRIVYYQAGRSEAVLRIPASNSLVHKLKIKESPFSQWLAAELRQRFDYACVDNMQSFRATERAVSIQGQVRHGKTRHEKDDRRKIEDRRYWVLGFDNRDKLSLFIRQAQDEADRFGELQQQLTALSGLQDQRHARVLQCQVIANMRWEDVDVAVLVERIEAISASIKLASEGNAELKTIDEQIKTQEQVVHQAEESLSDAKVKLKLTTDELSKQQRKLDAVQHDPSLLPLLKHHIESLDKRFATAQEVTLDNLDKVTTGVVQELAREIEETNSDINTCQTLIVERFATFKRLWASEAGDLDSSMASAPDFFAKLKRIETDGLPGFEERFFELLQNQSHQNLAALSSHIIQERKVIRDRLDVVNESLKHASFNPGTHLHIDADDRHLDEVREFRSQVQQILSHAWSETRENAEERFVALRQIVERLASQLPEDKRWKQSVLDVRHHVEFIAREINQEGRDIEVYRGGGGKSGGQKEKLAATCLAAALRYQLGGAENNVPTYAAVVLDEAFERGDNEFTALAMNIFVSLGFQMIVATPLKAVMTFEPFVGGACFVHISGRQNSAVLNIEYDFDEQRLKLPSTLHETTSIAVP